MARHIEVVPYNPEWPRLFEREAISIQQALGDNCIAIHHIGSTAVPGLAAKPKIDMLGVVKDPQKTISALESIGIQYKGEYNIPLHYGFSRRGEVDINLHVYEEGHPEIELNLVFRDYLRKNPPVRDSYARLKQALLEDAASFEKQNNFFTGYTLNKGAFIRQVLQEAGFKRIRLLKCNDAMEWEAASYFRQTYFFDKLAITDPYTWTFNHPDHVHLVLYQGTQLIGYAHIQLWPNQRAAMRIIVVEETKRNQGFGGQFLSLIEKWLKAQAYQRIHIESSPEALPFYQRYHYTEMPFNDPDGYPSDPRDIAIGKVLGNY